MNIISFSLYGDNPMYLRGAIENIKLAKIYYPEWKCRFYIDDSIKQELIEEIKFNVEELH